MPQVHIGEVTYEAAHAIRSKEINIKKNSPRLHSNQRTYILACVKLILILNHSPNKCIPHLHST